MCAGKPMKFRDYMIAGCFSLYEPIRLVKLCLTRWALFPSGPCCCISSYTRSSATARTTEQSQADYRLKDGSSAKKAEPFGLRRRAIQSGKSSYKPHKRITALALSSFRPLTLCRINQSGRSSRHRLDIPDIAVYQWKALQVSVVSFPSRSLGDQRD